MASIRLLGAAVIGHFDALAAANVAPYLPAELRTVPRANIEFLAIRDAWFSGSMNYLGRKRRPDGSPEYEATYEINASLDISLPEFLQLVSHEVVPGHVTTFAYLQDLYWRRAVGFEASVLTMNTRAAALFEGIANNAILMAYGVTEVDQLPDPDLQIGVLLALLQDDAKNQSSFLTWGEGVAQAEVAKTLRRDFLVSLERADKLSGAWGRHPLLGRMYLPAYRAGTRKVAALRRSYPAAKVLPALYGVNGLVDIATLERAIVCSDTSMKGQFRGMKGCIDITLPYRARIRGGLSCLCIRTTISSSIRRGFAGRRSTLKGVSRADSRTLLTKVGKRLRSPASWNGYGSARTVSNLISPMKQDSHEYQDRRDRHPFAAIGLRRA